MNAEVAEARRRLELFGVDGDFDRVLVESSGAQVLDCVVGGAGAERGEQELGRREAGVVAFVFGRLVAEDAMRAGFDFELDVFEVLDFDLHDLCPSHE